MGAFCVSWQVDVEQDVLRESQSDVVEHREYALREFDRRRCRSCQLLKLKR